MSSGVNIGVIVRARPLSEDEKSANTPVVLSCDPRKKEVLISASVRNKATKKTYTYDRVFGQFATQEEVYQGAVSSIVGEVLQGFNCTVFAYGQTGTGKTHTMQGDLSDVHSNQAGIVPRAVKHIFQKLGDPHKEYTVKVSCLQIYNEELQDLLDDEPLVTGANASTAKKQLRIFEDKAGKAVSIPELTEEIVDSEDAIFRILAKATAKRASAPTWLNKNSSRSHCIFTVTIHTKELAVDGQQIIRTGKLNLVDLAGSECVGKSGAVDERAKETGNINKSLLTLGRVINKLVEGQKHIPYRDSKLTRLLQESLGGRAKTVIIATVSPSLACMEETLNTLEYAHRAKNILNKPEVNETKTQKAFVKEMSSQINDLHAMLEASRSKNGVYLPEEIYQRMIADQESKNLLLADYEMEIQDKRKELEEFQVEHRKLQEQFDETLEKKIRLEKSLKEVQNELSDARHTIAQKDFIINVYQETERKLLSDAENTKCLLQESLIDINGLNMSLERWKNMEYRNISSVETLSSSINERALIFNSIMSDFFAVQKKYSANISNVVEEFLNREKDRLKLFGTELEAANVSYSEVSHAFSANLDNVHDKSKDILESFQHTQSACFKNASGSAASVMNQVNEFQSRAQESQKVMQSSIFESLTDLCAYIEEMNLHSSNLLATFETNQSSLIEECLMLLASTASLNQDSSKYLDNMHQTGVKELQLFGEEVVERMSQLISALVGKGISSMNDTKSETNSRFNSLFENNMKLETIIGNVNSNASSQISQMKEDLLNKKDVSLEKIEDVKSRNAQGASEMQTAIMEFSTAASTTTQQVIYNVSGALEEACKYHSDVLNHLDSFKENSHKYISHLDNRLSEIVSKQAKHGASVARAHNSFHEELFSKKNENDVRLVNSSNSSSSHLMEIESTVDNFTNSFVKYSPTQMTPKKKSVQVPKEFSVTPSIESLVKSFEEQEREPVSKDNNVNGPHVDQSPKNDIDENAIPPQQVNLKKMCLDDRSEKTTLVEKPSTTPAKSLTEKRTVNTKRKLRERQHNI